MKKKIVTSNLTCLCRQATAQWGAFLFTCQHRIAARLTTLAMTVAYVIASRRRGNPVRQSAGASTKAFSLIELLISIIIISLIAAAFTPMLTKNIKPKDLVIASKSKSIDCTRFSNDCIACSELSCTICSTSLDLEDGFYVNPNTSCDKKPCTDFDPNCQKCSSTGCKECKPGYELDENKKCKSKIKDYPPSHENCAKVNAMYIPASINGTKDLCVSKFNIGDKNGLTLADDIEIRTAQLSTGAPVGMNSKVCWQGATTTSCKISSEAAKYGFTYDPCTRTICTWQAAYETCKKHGWRLPKKSELDNWNKNFYQVTKFLGERGLQFCGHVANWHPQCDHAAGCKGLYGGSEECTPDAIWADATLSSTYVTVAYLGNDIFQDYTVTKNRALSARCVAESVRF